MVDAEVVDARSAATAPGSLAAMVEGLGHWGFETRSVGK